MVDVSRYAFNLSAWNELAGLDDHFTMLYYNKNNGETDIEIVNPKTKRRQLARIAYPHLKAENIRPGGKLVIFGKQYNVEDFGCPFTREQLGKMSQTTVGVLSGPAVARFGQIWSIAEASGVRVVGARAVYLSGADAVATAAHFVNGQKLEEGQIVVLQVLGADVAEKIASVFSHVCEELNIPRSALSIASALGAAPLSAAFFGKASERLMSTRSFSAEASFANTACVIVLPHILLSGTAGALLTDIGDAVRSSSEAIAPLAFGNIRLMDLTRAQAEEFLEVYKNVVPEYVDLINEYSSGPLIAIELRGEDAVLRMREIAGPRDIDVALRIRPNSLRAKYGVSASLGGPGGRAKLAIHTTELPEDGPLECETLFSLIDV